jgi:hypothetical protein
MVVLRSETPSINAAAAPARDVLAGTDDEIVVGRTRQGGAEFEGFADLVRTA